MANLYSIRKIIKIPSSMLSNAQPKWNLKVSVEELSKANQLVGLASNYVIRTLDKLAQTNYSEERIKELKKEKGIITKEKTTKSNKTKIKELNHEMFNLLYVPHLCCIHIDKNAHYDKLNKGFTITLFSEDTGEIISSVRYVRFLSTSASIKKSEVFYINEEYKEVMMEYIDCGRNMEIKFVPAKLSAYMALTMSSSNPVSNTYNVCVVNDVEYEITTQVLELDDSKQEEPIITQIDDYKMNLNCSDGFGFIDPTFAQTWANDLHLDYTPSSFITRNAFCKGVLARFPYKEFAKENGIDTIKDVWGRVWDIDEVDIVLTTSMLKLSNCYASWDDYYTQTQKYGYTFSVTKQTPKVLDMERTTNYQFIQAMDWDDEDIRGFLKHSLDEIKSIRGMDWRKALVYLRGMSLNEDSDVLRSDYTTALMIEPKLMEDSYVKTSINNMIKKRIDDCKKGTIKVKGNYQTVICDPIILAQGMLGLSIKGLLQADEFHSEFWNKQGVDYVVQFRAPQVSYNNIGHAKLVSNENTKRWYRYLGEMFIFNGYDATCARMSGCDFDGDTIFSTDDKYIIKGARQKVLPIVCLQKSADKVICDETSFINADKLLLKGGIENVGTITNRATSIESFKARFPRDSKEWEELNYRVQACIALSQSSIDCAKGIKIEYGFPKSWISHKVNMVNEDDDEETIKHKEYYNTLVCDKKPYFFIYVYDHLRKEYNKLKKDENKHCLREFAKPLQEILNNPLTEEEKTMVYYYNRKQVVDESPSVMNKIAWFVEEEFKTFTLPKLEKDELAELLKTENDYSKANYNKVKPLYHEYLELMKNMNKTFTLSKVGSNEKTIMRETAFSELKNKLLTICSNEEELCNIVVDICYKDMKNSKHFAWAMCGQQIIKNLLSKKDNMIAYPIMVKDERGDFEYKGYKFKMYTKGIEQ